MQANFGYRDGSGEFYITLETDHCNGCGDCVSVCPAKMWELAANEYNPLAEGRIAMIKVASRKSVKYDCGPCKPPSGARSLPCVSACKTAAISHSW